MLTAVPALAALLLTAPSASAEDPAQDAPLPPGVADAAPGTSADGEATDEPDVPQPVSYALDPAQGSTYILVRKDPSTLASGLSHDHAIQAAGHGGTFTWNAAEPSACKLVVRVPVAQLQVDPPALREAVGLEGELSDGQRADVRKNMLSKDQLWASAHPAITFQSRGCVGDGERFEVEGDLSIRGRSRSVILRGTLSADDQAVALSGTLPLRATDYGFEPYTAMFGQLKNLDEMTLVIDLRGTAD